MNPLQELIHLTKELKSIEKQPYTGLAISSWGDKYYFDPNLFKKWENFYEVERKRIINKIEKLRLIFKPLS